MTNHWLIEDIEKHLLKTGRTVVIDPQQNFAHLAELLKTHGYLVLTTDNSLVEDWQTTREELLLRYDAEKHFAETPVVFYTTRSREKLSFLFDYCFTHGCLDLSNPHEWIRNKLFGSTGLQVKMDNNLLITAAKIGKEKSSAWWKKVLQNLEDLIDVSDDLLPFLNDPDTYLRSKDPDVKRLFEEKLFEMIGQPYMKKPAKTLASEFVNTLFNQLLCNEADELMLQLYHKWVDSNTYDGLLKSYVNTFAIPAGANPWGAHPEHCFEVLDKLALKQLCENLSDRSYINTKLQRIRARVSSRKARKMVPSWWSDIITLLTFDNAKLSSCSTFESVTEYYTTVFHPLDRAIRNLYENFLSEKTIIRPLQEYYDDLNNQLLDRWFQLSNGYKQNQQGCLVDYLKNAQPKTAVIIGDGLRYEIAAHIAASVETNCRVNRSTMIADMPSETEHNMSALYVGDNQVLPIHKDREKRLAELSGKEIKCLNLEALNPTIDADYLLLTYKDIDSAGESLQLGAIKLFAEFERVITDKILLLLNMGYKEVRLITDHGFVLTGLLDEADKIDPNATGVKEVHERFIRTVDIQHNSNWIEFKRKYGAFNYVYAAKNHRPFKSKGVYGFSHGGFTPQEIIIPDFTFSKHREADKGLKVSIANKNDLAEVTGNMFGVKLHAATDATDLFSAQRKVQILLYANNKQVGSSSVITAEPGTNLNFEFSFNQHTSLHIVLVDAITQEQLDSTKTEKSNARDMGGLF